MDQPSHRARLTACSGPADRGLRLLALAACFAGLAGCAGIAQKPTVNPTSSAIDPNEAQWMAASDDPIGMLLAAQTLKRERQRDHNGDNAMVSEALNYLGIRYRFGGGSPETGFDCSGLVAYTAERSLGLTLPRSSADIAQQGASVAKNKLKAGDLVFFNTLGRRYSHVGIYLGEHRFVHAPSAGGVVRVENMTMAYWAKRYNGARRLHSRLPAAAHAAN